MLVLVKFYASVLLEICPWRWSRRDSTKKPLAAGAAPLASGNKVLT
jgi:hypothetical protein